MKYFLCVLALLFSWCNITQAGCRGGQCGQPARQVMQGVAPRASVRHVERYRGKRVVEFGRTRHQRGGGIFQAIFFPYANGD